MNLSNNLNYRAYGQERMLKIIEAVKYLRYLSAKDIGDLFFDISNFSSTEIRNRKTQQILNTLVKTKKLNRYFEYDKNFNCFVYYPYGKRLTKYCTHGAYCSRIYTVLSTRLPSWLKIEEFKLEYDFLGLTKPDIYCVIKNVATGVSKIFLIEVDLDNVKQRTLSKYATDDGKEVQQFCEKPTGFIVV